MRARWRIEIFAPLTRGRGGLHDLREDLAARFGGVTAFERAPAVGLRREDGGEGEEAAEAVTQDSIVVLEVVADDFDPNWWGAFREGWEARLGQRRLLVRASRVMEI
jgi:hypothetical protein